MKNLLNIKFKASQLYTYAGIALAVMIAVWLAWYEHQKVKGFISRSGKKEEQPSKKLKFIYPIEYQKEIQYDTITPGKFPAFQLNSDEFFIWDTYVRDKEMAAALFSRGVTQMNVLKAKEIGYELPKGKRFNILYRDFFLDFTYANLPEMKRRLADEISSYNPGGVDVINFDLENDQYTQEYASVARELALFARQEMGVKYVDFLGMPIAAEDWAVSGHPLTESFFGPYFRDVISYDDAYPYLQIHWFDNGDWLYSVVHTAERARLIDPALPTISFWWSKDYTGQMYVPDFICHAVPIFILFCGGKGLINWEGATHGLNLAPDEALMSGFYRASLANDVRTGEPEFLTPEISLDGGKTWVNNDALTAKQNRHPIVRVCRNATGTVVVGQNPVLDAKSLDVTFKVKELQDTIRLRDRETYMGRV